MQTIRQRAIAETERAFRLASAAGIAGPIAMIAILRDADYDPRLSKDACEELAIDALYARKQTIVNRLLRIAAAWEAIRIGSTEIAGLFLR
jgi:hypothetical protein